MTTTIPTFSKLTHTEALMEADTRQTWLVEGLISGTTTLLYGEAKVGKSFLTSAFIASLLSGNDFLGKPVPTDREFSVAVCWTDDDGAGDYAAQIDTVLSDDIPRTVEYYMLPVMRSGAWQSLYDQVMADGHNFVVIDNMTQCLDGSFNQDEVVRSFFDGVRLFTRSGIPVLIIGHSTDKAGVNGYKSDKPMGSATISQSVRWKCFVKRSRRGNLTLTFSGNYAEQHEMTLHHGTGARFEVIDVKDADAVSREADNRASQRSAETFDQNRKMAEWVAANCQGLSMNQAAKKAKDSGEFGGLEEETIRGKLKSSGPVGKMLDRTEDGGSTSWSLVGG